MPTLYDNINRIESAKKAMINSIVAKGVAVPADTKIESLPAKIDSIQEGSKKPSLKSLAVTENGTYVPETGYDGYNKVDVSVASSTSSNFDLSGTGWDDGIEEDFPVDITRLNYLKQDLDYTRKKYAEWDPSTTNASSIFDGDKQLIYAPKIDTSNVTNMNGMLAYCDLLVSVPKFDTSNVTKMDFMFYSSPKLATVPLFDTSKVTDMTQMFSHCNALVSVPRFDTSKVTDMGFMFNCCSSLTTVPLLDTSNLANYAVMGGMFNECTSLTDLGGFIGLKCSLDLSDCPKLTKQSVLNIFNYASTVSYHQTITLHSSVKSQLSQEDLAIAENKGWEIQ